MIPRNEQIVIGSVLRYWPPQGAHKDTGICVMVKGFRKGFVETDGIDDGRHRSVSRLRLTRE